MQTVKGTTEAKMIGVIEIVSVLDVAGLPVVQVMLEVITTYIISPSLNALLVYVLFVESTTATPFKYHWYVGVVPPFTGLAVNVIGDPAQISVPGSAVIVTDAATLLIVETVVVALLVQPFALVIVTVNTSPFAGATAVATAEEALLIAPVPLVVHA